MDAYSLHLAMAPLVGASFVAIAAYYMHRKTLTLLLEFARTVERKRDEEGKPRRSQNQHRRRGAGYYRYGRGSASMPDVMRAEADEVEDEEVRPALNEMGIPPRLPRLQMIPEDVAEKARVEALQMAKRTDFAQKLLEDLRLRKERMGLAPPGARSGQTPPANAHTISQRSLRSSKNASTSKLSNRNMVNREVTNIGVGTRQHKTHICEGTSQDIIPFRRNTHVDPTVDVSMALALVLSNSGKLQNIEFFSNAIMSKEHIMHHGSLDFRQNERIMTNKPRYASTQFHFSSHLDIGEGVQRLNTILKGCTNGLRFNRNAIDIGRELLKGAIDLEESLRMLATLQEASDHMVGCQTKQVKLLKGKEDDSSSREVNNKKLMITPRFSFDGPSKHSNNLHIEENGACYTDQNQFASSYLETSKTFASNSNKRPSRTSIKYTHYKGSVKSNSDSRTDVQFSGTTDKISNSGVLKSFKTESDHISRQEITKKSVPRTIPSGEKIRIPNVVAKLMGLEELPVGNAEMRNTEIQEITKSKKATEMRKLSLVKAEKKISETILKPKNVTSKISQIDDGNKREVDVVLYKEYGHTYRQKMVLQAKNITEQHINSTMAVVRKEKTKLKDQNEMENPKPELKPHFNINYKQLDETDFTYIKETRDTKKEQAKIEATILKEQACKGKEKPIKFDNETVFLEQDMISTAPLPYTCHYDAATKNESLIQRKRNLPEGNKHVELIPKNQMNTGKIKMPQHQPGVYRLQPNHKIHGIRKDKEHSERSKEQINIEKKPDVYPQKRGAKEALPCNSTTIASKINSTNLESSHHAKIHTKSRSVSYRNQVRTDRSLRDRGTLKTESVTDKEKYASLILKPTSKKPEKVRSEHKLHTTGSNRKLEEDARISKSMLVKHQPLMDHTLFLQELEHRWKERTGKVGNVIVKSEEHMQQNTAAGSLPCNPLGDDCRISTLAKRRLAEETNTPDRTIAISSAQEPGEPSPWSDVEQQLILKENQSEGQRETMHLSKSSSLQNDTITEVDRRHKLTTKEKFLKQTLISCQNFLNTTQAIFKIEIPVGILHASEVLCADEDCKVVLDCAYEIMRRKGKRQEVNLAQRMLSSPTKVRCFDTLIIELNNDLERLKFPGKIDGDSDNSEYFHELLEGEILNNNPDVNCMWDFGWNSYASADIDKNGITRDVEKHVLNGLITELARDLLNVCIITK